MADLAAIFHWPPDVLRAMSLTELLRWQDRAVERFKIMRS